MQEVQNVGANTMDETCVLVVDDEPKLVRLVCEVLSAIGYKVLSTGKGETAIKMAAREQPDLILLDIILAGKIDGYEVARRVREFSDVPIVMLTAKTRELDLIKGFNAGADDYLTKPFSSRELIVRLEAVLRRARREPASQEDTQIRCGPLSIDLTRRRVTVNEQAVHLTKTEYNLLHELATHRNQVLLHEQLLSAVWGPQYRDDIEYLRAYIRYLRRKIESDPSNPQLIQTCQGVGYMLACTEEPD